MIIEMIAIELFERKNELEKSDTKSLIIPPKKIIGIVAIKIDLINLLQIKELKILLDLTSKKLIISFLKYQMIAKTLPNCIIADKEEPGSSIPMNKDNTFK